MEEEDVGDEIEDFRLLEERWFWRRYCCSLLLPCVGCSEDVDDEEDGEDDDGLCGSSSKVSVLLLLLLLQLGKS